MTPGKKQQLSAMLGIVANLSLLIFMIGLIILLAIGE